MINLEEEARKRRERLKLSLNSSNESNIEKEENSKVAADTSNVTEKRNIELVTKEYTVPVGEVILDSTGAEILSIDSK